METMIVCLSRCLRNCYYVVLMCWHRQIVSNGILTPKNRSLVVWRRRGGLIWTLDTACRLRIGPERQTAVQCKVARSIPARSVFFSFHLFPPLKFPVAILEPLSDRRLSLAWCTGVRCCGRGQRGCSHIACDRLPRRIDTLQWKAA